MSQVLGENSLPKYTAIMKHKIQQVDEKVNKLTDGAAPGKFLGCSETGKITFYLKDHYDISELVEKISEYVNSAAELNGYVQDFWYDSNLPDGDYFLVYYSPQSNNLYYDVRINGTWDGAHYSFDTNSWLQYIEGDEVDCATPVISIDSECLWNDHYYFPPYDIYCEKIEYPIGWQEPNGSYVELTKAEYDALATKDPDTIYFVKDEDPQNGVIYKNSVKYSIKGDKGDKGDSGVYVGSGTMPAGYNVQIDPTGDISVVEETITNVVTPTRADTLTLKRAGNVAFLTMVNVNFGSYSSDTLVAKLSVRPFERTYFMAYTRIGGYSVWRIDTDGNFYCSKSSDLVYGSVAFLCDMSEQEDEV